MAFLQLITLLRSLCRPFAPECFVPSRRQRYHVWLGQRSQVAAAALWQSQQMPQLRGYFDVGSGEPGAGATWKQDKKTGWGDGKGYGWMNTRRACSWAFTLLGMLQLFHINPEFGIERLKLEMRKSNSIATVSHTFLVIHDWRGDDGVDRPTYALMISTLSAHRSISNLRHQNRETITGEARKENYRLW